MNSVNIIGTITKDIELKYLPSGSALANFSVAINQDYKDKQGQQVKKTTFIDCKSFGKQSEIINQYFHKGSRIGILGELDQENWKAKDGSNRSKISVKIDKFFFIDRKSDNKSQQQQGYQQQPQQQQGYQQQPQQQQQYQPQTIDVDDDDVIPF